jgi:MoaA/NifB/PqqE/SkfB family radical SAM enzyme
VPKKLELTLDEWERVIKSLGSSPYWITVSGGEPFLRRDLVDLVRTIDEYNKPKIINIPTNAILWKIIPTKTKEILENISDQTTLVINFSLDGIGMDHDEIRGIPGNFEFLKRAYRGVVELKGKFSNLVVGIHTVVSSSNVHKLPEIYEVVMEEFSPDQFISEVAEERNEMDNFGRGITPPPEEIAKAMDFLIAKTKEGLKNRGWNGFSRTTALFRVHYYELVKRFFMTKAEQVPSYAGFASAQISPTGDVWECAVYATKMGNLRDYDYDFKKLWHSKSARTVREFVKKGHPCPLANEHYTNMLLSPKYLLKIIKQSLVA